MPQAVDISSPWFWFFLVTAIMAGWFSGILVNYLSDVLPVRRKITLPFCHKCNQPIAWVNYFFWPRRCKSCGQKRSARTWIVESLAVLASIFLVIRPPERLGLAAGWLWLIYFGIIIVIDLEHHLILHPISLAGAVGGFVTGWWNHGLLPTLIGGAAGFGIMWVFYVLGIKVLKWINLRRGKPIEEEEAIGFGDVTLSGVIGLILGWPGVIAGLVLAILLGGAASLIAIGIAAIQKRYHVGMAIPYGPFLALSALFLLFR